MAVSDGSVTKHVLVTDLEVTTFDVAANTLSGTKGASPEWGGLTVHLANMYPEDGVNAPVSYAATDSHPLVLEPCHYLVNVDHYHYDSIFRMIGGDDETWSGSVVLRRLLFPVIAYPFVMALWFSLTSIRVGDAGQFVGLANFSKAIEDTIFQQAFKNTVFYTFWATIFTVYVTPLASPYASSVLKRLATRDGVSKARGSDRIRASLARRNSSSGTGSTRSGRRCRYRVVARFCSTSR